MFASLLSGCSAPAATPQEADAGAPTDAAPGRDAAPRDLLPPPVVVTAAVDPSRPGATVAPSFAGFSLSWAELFDYTGHVANGIDTSLIQLLKNLDGGPPSLRLGKGSDAAWWNPKGLPKPQGITTDITPDSLDALSAIVKATGSRLILGLDLAANDPAGAAAFVSAATSALPAGSIQAFELGDEPDRYATSGARPMGYSFADYSKDVSGYLAALSPMMGAPPLAAPAWASLDWGASFASLLDADAKQLALATLHRYAFSACNLKPGNPGYPRVADLLGDGNAAIASDLAPYVAAAKNDGLDLRLDEAGPVDCGADGISNAFAAALWAVDFEWNLARAGVSGVDFHNQEMKSAAFHFAPMTDPKGKVSYTPSVFALYYGALFFSRASSNGSRLVPSTVDTSANISVWAAIDKDQVLRVTVLDKDTQVGGTAIITLASPRGDGSLVRLGAPSPQVTSGISIGGQTFDGSDDGRPMGALSVETVHVDGNGRYAFVIAPASAALLTIK